MITNSLGSLFQCLKDLSVKKFFLKSYLNLPWNSLGPFAFTLLLVMWQETLSTLVSALNSSSYLDLPDLTLVCPKGSLCICLYVFILKLESHYVPLSLVDTLQKPTRYPSVGLPAGMTYPIWKFEKSPGKQQGASE